MITASPRAVEPRASMASLRRLARTTPGVVGMVAIVVAALCVITGLVCGAQLDGRIAKRNEILERSEPFAYAAQNLYAALSAADAAATSAFLSSGTEKASVRARYQQALADAAAALTDVTAGAGDADDRAAVAQMSSQMTAYAGLVESARANNRQGLSIGSAYLREASSLMQSALLPAAEKIHTRDLAALDEDQWAAGSMPAIALALLVLALVAIGVGSVIVYARTNRVFNVGLVAAGAAVLVAIGWIVVATGLAAANIEHSRTEGTARFAQLSKARILAQQARTDETLQLIERGDITASENSFQGHIGQVGTLISAGPSAAVDSVARWNASHRKHVEAYEGGDYPAAVAQAIGADPSASAAQFAAVESSLRQEIERTRATTRDHVSAAGAALAWSPTGTLALMVVAATATVAGLWPRLKEFL